MTVLSKPHDSRIPINSRSCRTRSTTCTAAPAVRTPPHKLSRLPIRTCDLVVPFPHRMHAAAAVESAVGFPGYRSWWPRSSEFVQRAQTAFYKYPWEWHPIHPVPGTRSAHQRTRIRPRSSDTTPHSRSRNTRRLRRLKSKARGSRPKLAAAAAAAAALAAAPSAPAGGSVGARSLAREAPTWLATRGSEDWGGRGWEAGGGKPCESGARYGRSVSSRDGIPHKNRNTLRCRLRHPGGNAREGWRAERRQNDGRRPNGCSGVPSPPQRWRQTGTCRWAHVLPLLDPDIPCCASTHTATRPGGAPPSMPPPQM
jgi:hypothetical protein